MGKKMMSIGKILDSICLSNGGASSCLCCLNNFEIQDDYEFEREPLVDQSKDASDKPQTLAFFLKPKMVVLRVSMHCNGCARKVQRHISKMDGVTSYQVDLETKMVIVMGDIVPFEVLESVSKVKNAQLWAEPPTSP
uniref:protein SODIUM POTASSIUM ROOT DEFECTIVE 2 n=1 Tax=Erigeron canadensis TaxID=72917 RepID=UPI001CB91EA9|nr:protein SODIUM POTASSIUM ROOT DEFECTIVE 2 [Erigeron canadensis]